MMKLFKNPLVSVIASLLFAGCARYPQLPSPSGEEVDRLTIEFDIAGKVNSQYYYFVAFDDDDDPNDGPLPAVVRPFGNGWGTGSFTRFIEVHLNRATLYKVNPNDPLQPDWLGYPLEFEQKSDSIRIVIDMNTFFEAIPEALDFNIIAVDEIILDPNYEGIRSYDALGPLGNDYVTIPLQATQEFSNGQGVFIREQAGDAPLEDLDISDWRIIVLRGKR